MKTKGTIPAHTVGVDLGDRKECDCQLEADGEVVERRSRAPPRSPHSYCSSQPAAVRRRSSP